MKPEAAKRLREVDFKGEMNDSSSIFAGRMWAEEELRLQRMEELSADLRIAMDTGIVRKEIDLARD